MWRDTCPSRRGVAQAHKSAMAGSEAFCKCDRAAQLWVGVVTSFEHFAFCHGLAHFSQVQEKRKWTPICSPPPTASDGVRMSVL
jgi:hypothetical protein